jgi:hypothetical protein
MLVDQQLETLQADFETVLPVQSHKALASNHTNRFRPITRIAPITQIVSPLFPIRPSASPRNRATVTMAKPEDTNRPGQKAEVFSSLCAWSRFTVV